MTEVIRPAVSRSIVVVVLALMGTACNKSPSAPTPTPVVVAPPPADPPELTCPSSITVAAPTSAGLTVTYPTPESRKGQGNVSVACTPSSGSRFPIGVTQTECVATDTLNRTASCNFSVTVAAPPRLQRTRIMAFGDSLTLGVTILGNDPYVNVVAPETAYPTVLSQLLTARYTDQRITVFNEGMPGELASRALPRFNLVFQGDAPDVVVLQEGYNDFNLSDNKSDGIEGAIRGITELTSDARRKGARVFLCTLAPSRAGRVGIPTSAIEYINDRIRVIARGEGAVLVDIYNALAPDVLGNVSIDGLHLSPLGYRRVAETVFAAIRADLEVR